MNKLISNPTECGYRVQAFTRLGLPTGIYGCKHHSFIAGTQPCISGKIFPINCPLQDGMTYEQFLKQQKPKIVHVRNNTYKEELSDGSGLAQLRHDAEQLSIKPKRRNRKDCIYFRNTIVFSGQCAVTKSMYFPKCKGVNCGFFTKQ